MNKINLKMNIKRQLPFLNKWMPKYLNVVTISNTELLSIKSYFVCLPASNIMIFVFLVFTFNPHKLQYVSRSFKRDCNACGVSANNTASSQNNNIYIFNSFTANIPSIFELKFKVLVSTENL